jgi:geranylgeranyl reductase family protein
MFGTFDAAVCGAGPAGSAAACVLAGRGRKVALLDRALFPRKKLCGGLLTWKTVRRLEAVFGLDEAALAREGLVDWSADSYALVHRGRVMARGRVPHPFLLVDRARLDHHLLLLAERAGASVFPGVGVSQCSPGEGLVATTDGHEISAGYVIGADGANSRLRRALAAKGGQDAERGRRAWRAGLARAVEFHLPRDEAPAPLRSLAEPQLHVGHVLAGYAWVFPGKDRLCVGMCGLEAGDRPLLEHFAEFTGLLGFDPGRIHLRAHPLPYGNWIAEPCRERLLLAGDAAGMVEPLLGEGIFYALSSGAFAASAVDQAMSRKDDPCRTYPALLARHLLPELRGADTLRNLFLKTVRLAGYAPFGLFMRLAARPLGELVHGHRSWRLLRRKAWDFDAGNA